MLQQYLQAFSRLNKQGFANVTSKLLRGLSVSASSWSDGFVRGSVQSLQSRWSKDLEVPLEQNASRAFHEGGGKVHLFYWVFAFLTISFRDEIFLLCKNNLLDSTSVVKTHSDLSKMKKIKPIITKYTRQLSKENVEVFLAGKQLLASQHQAEQDPTARVVQPVDLSDEDKLFLHRLAQFSTASYGWRTLYSYGLGSWRMVGSNKRAVELLMSVARKDIVAMENKSELYRPGYFITVDHETRSIIVTVRGTTRLQDCITGITCTNVPLVIRADSGQIVHGVVHEGFYQSAGYLNSSILPKVTEAMHKYPEYEIVTTGHSMGGACAALLTLLWTQLPEFDGNHHRLKSFSFGSPGVVCSKLASSAFVKDKVSAYVLGNDLIPRLSLASFEQFVQDCEQRGRSGASRGFKTAEHPVEGVEKLFPCGTCYHIPTHVVDSSRDGSAQDLVGQVREVDQTVALQSIHLGDSMLAAHLPVNYIHAISMQEISA